MSSYILKSTQLLMEMRWKMRILCLYNYIITKLNINQKSYTYRSWNWRDRHRSSSTASYRHQPWKSGILLLEIKRKVVILGLDIIILILVKR